jgi:hypothetical protein
MEAPSYFNRFNYKEKKYHQKDINNLLQQLIRLKQEDKLWEKNINILKA